MEDQADLVVLDPGGCPRHLQNMFVSRGINNGKYVVVLAEVEALRKEVAAKLTRATWA